MLGFRIGSKSLTGGGRRSTPGKFQDRYQQAYSAISYNTGDITRERPAGSWASMSSTGLVSTIARHVVEFCDWLSDPPMTKRDRINRYIVETRIASYQRYLAGR